MAACRRGPCGLHRPRHLEGHGIRNRGGEGRWKTRRVSLAILERVTTGRPLRRAAFVDFVVIEIRQQVLAVREAARGFVFLETFRRFVAPTARARETIPHE